MRQIMATLALHFQPSFG